uniref:Uncharacterized protein n=1 Tax=Coturnix japonica TaxID=93934 RepID=A0A8C2Y8K4_COTJA
MAVSADAVVVEEAEPQQVDDEPRHPHGDDHQRLLDLVGLGEALDGLQQDGEAERGEEHGVDQGAHHLGPHPAERVLLGGAGALCEAHGHQRHDQGHDVGEHVERVGQHGQRRRDAAHRHLHHEEQERELGKFCRYGILWNERNVFTADWPVTFLIITEINYPS